MVFPSKHWNTLWGPRFQILPENQLLWNCNILTLPQGVGSVQFQGETSCLQNKSNLFTGTVRHRASETRLSPWSLPWLQVNITLYFLSLTLSYILHSPYKTPVCSSFYKVNRIFKSAEALAITKKKITPSTANTMFKNYWSRAFYLQISSENNLISIGNNAPGIKLNIL